MCLMACIAVSCNNDSDEANLTNDFSRNQIGNDSIVMYEDLFSETTNAKKTETRASNGEIVEDELVVVYGSDRTESVKKAKIALIVKSK